LKTFTFLYSKQDDKWYSFRKLDFWNRTNKLGQKK